jgi:hypothetical protein
MFRDCISENNVFTTGEDFVAEFVSSEGLCSERGDTRRNSGISWRSPCLALFRNTGFVGKGSQLHWLEGTFHRLSTIPEIENRKSRNGSLVSYVMLEAFIMTWKT